MNLPLPITKESQSAFEAELNSISDHIVSKAVSNYLGRPVTKDDIGVSEKVYQKTGVNFHVRYNGITLGEARFKFGSGEWKASFVPSEVI